MNTDQLRLVELRNVPVALWHESRRWFDELLREFAVVTTSSPELEVPRQLLEFVDEVRGRFSRFSETTNLTLEAAHADGRPHVDVRLELPTAAGPVARQLYDHVLRADQVCREGHLLATEMSEPAMRFIEWYLGEVERQLTGSAPTSWAESET